MFEKIIKASENFCVHQLDLPYILEDGITKNRTLIAYIDMTVNESDGFRVYIAAQDTFIQKVAKLFLDEDESDEETLIDMTLETANLIIGSAKVLIQEDDNILCSIKTPHFEKIGSFDFAYDMAKSIKIENETMSIAIKEL